MAPAYSLVSDYFPKAQRARALAAYSFGIPVGSGLALVIGRLPRAWPLAAALGVCAAMCCLTLSRMRRRRAAKRKPPKDGR